MNILILSAGSRNLVIKHFREALAGRGHVIAADASPIAPALYEADSYYTVPRINDPEYLDAVLNICNEEHVCGILSLIDPELSLLAKNTERFNDAGVMVIGSSYDLCEMSLDKLEMYRWLNAHGYRCATTWSNEKDFLAAFASGDVVFPVFVKPRRGSASISISRVNDIDTARFLLAADDDLIVQEFLDGQEIGADVYIDMISGEVVSIFTKRKLAMRAGETDKAVSFKDEALFELIEEFVRDAGYRGQIDIDIFEIDGNYFLSEVNPRFGGGYPHAYVCGCDHMSLITNNLEGLTNAPRIGAYVEGVYMMKYNDIVWGSDDGGGFICPKSNLEKRHSSTCRGDEI